MNFFGKNIYAVVLSWLVLAWVAPRGAEGAGASKINSARDRFSTTEESGDALLIEGLATDSKGGPAGGAAISAVILSRRVAPDPLEGSTAAVEEGRAKADKEGRFRMRIRKLTERDIALELSASLGGVMGFKDVPLDKSKVEVRIKIPDARNIPIQLLGPNGKPLSSAGVSVVRFLVKVGNEPSAWFTAPANGGQGWPEPYVTDANGMGTVISTPEISEVELEIDDRRVARQRWVVPTSSNLTVLRSEKGRVIEGTVVARDSKRPLPGTSITITSWDERRFVGTMFTKADGMGRFSLRPFVGERLSILVDAPNQKYFDQSREIPWIGGTSTQRMFFSLIGKGFEPVDGTTADGGHGSSIETDYPTRKVLHRRPTERMEKIPGGVIVAEGSVTTNAGGRKGTFQGVIRIDPRTGEWHSLVEGGAHPRVSRSGKKLSFVSRDQKRKLRVISLDEPGEAKEIVEKCEGAASWGAADETLVANIHDPAPQDYHGQEYWAQENEKYMLGVERGALREIKVPQLYDVFDVSPDGDWIAMHWDTHSSMTGAQLYVARIDGSELKPVARKRFQYYWYPRFSPDGKKVVAKHLEAKGGAISIRIINVDGSSEQAITLGEDFVPEVACWSPDGRCLAISTYQAAAFKGGRKIGKLFVVDCEGKEFREITLVGTSEVGITSLDWQLVKDIAGK